VPCKACNLRLAPHKAVIYTPCTLRVATPRLAILDPTLPSLDNFLKNFVTKMTWLTILNALLTKTNFNLLKN
jgi:hypothetical protein